MKGTQAAKDNVTFLDSNIDSEFLGRGVHFGRREQLSGNGECSADCEHRGTPVVPLPADQLVLQLVETWRRNRINYY